MPHRTTRILAILQSLREHRRPVTAKMLALEFDVSERTIYRDIATLTDLGARIRGEAGVGFVLGPGFFLPPLSLSELEADALLLGLRFVARRGDPDLAHAAQAALAKLATTLDPDTERTMRMNGLAVAPSGSGETERIGIVRRAMEAERKLRIAYIDKSGNQSDRTIWPVALGFFDETEIMIAWCESREAFRHFRLDRLVSLEVLADPIPTPRRSLLANYRIEEPRADL